MPSLTAFRLGALAHYERRTLVSTLFAAASSWLAYRYAGGDTPNPLDERLLPGVGTEGKGTLKVFTVSRAEWQELDSKMRRLAQLDALNIRTQYTMAINHYVAQMPSRRLAEAEQLYEQARR